MSQHIPQQPFYPPQARLPAPPKKSGRSVVIAIVSGLVGIFIGAGVTAAAMSSDTAGTSSKNPASSVSSTPPDTGPTPDPITTPTNEYTPPPEPTYSAPAKADFKLTVKVLSKKCFGSAGCNLTYRILVAYGGPDLDPSATYEVLYQVRGGEDGPVDNKLTVTGTQSSVDEEEYVSTKSSKTKLTAVVTEVLSQ